MSFAFLRPGVALAALAFSLAAPAQSNHSAPVPVAKSEVRAAFVALPMEVPITLVALPPVDPSQIEAARLGNSHGVQKRVQLGVGVMAEGIPGADSGALAWHALDGGHVARWEVSSAGAEALRVELHARALPPGVEFRFAGSADPGTVYGPFHATDFYPDSHTVWSPALPGEVATIELFVPRGVDPRSVAVAVTRVSHLFANPFGSEFGLRAKTTGSCSQDFICKAASDASLANAGKAVARMLFSEGSNSFVCTGTLLNPTDGTPTPYFYSAAHCISSQLVASTLATYWFYDRTACDSGVQNPAAVQITGGATLLYSNVNSDVLLLSLNNAPPAGAVRAGWDAATLANGAGLTAVHHPGGNLKAVSLGSVGGFQNGIGGGPSGSFVISNWTEGITEGGSSGSGIFTGSSGAGYKLRGGLWGGPSSCSNPSAPRLDYYSRLDQAYTSIRQWIDPPPPPGTALTVTKLGTGTGTVNSSPAGISCGTTCSASFTTGASVTLNATPTGGSVFGGWGGACSGSGQCTVTMDVAKSVSATFSPPGTGVNLSVSKTGTGSGTVTSSQGGISCQPACSVQMDGGLVVSLYPEASAGSSFTGWSGDCSGVSPCTVTMDRARTVAAAFSTGGTSNMINISTSAIAFGGQSMGTTSPPSPIVIMNIGPNTVTFSGIAASGQFGQGGSCNSVPIAPGRSCDLNVTFAPATTSIALGQSAPVTGQLTINSIAAGSPHAVALTGTAEKSFVSHYYRSILRRAPDAGGKAFWEAEAQRLVGLGVSVNEAWYAMAMSFYGSAEYAAFNRGNAAYVTDLYNTFFNRTPEGAGLSFWNNEIAGGLPRGVALAAFMFSTEFRNFSQSVFGSAAVRPEIDAVVDFYRGLLGRLPDSSGFTFWLQRFRAAQCSSQAAVVAEVEAISTSFANGAEYVGRARTHPDYIGDLYNAFLRRGGDLGGVQFWINQVATAAQTREQVRAQFKSSAEFQARVNAILAATCIP